MNNNKSRFVLKNGLLLYYAGIVCSVIGTVTTLTILYELWFGKNPGADFEANLFLIISPFVLIAIGGLGIFIMIAGRHLMTGRTITWTTQITGLDEDGLNKRIEKAVSTASDDVDVEQISKKFGVTEEDVLGTMEHLKKAGLLSKDTSWKPAESEK